MPLLRVINGTGLRLENIDRPHVVQGTLASSTSKHYPPVSVGAESALVVELAEEGVEHRYRAELDVHLDLEAGTRITFKYIKFCE